MEFHEKLQAFRKQKGLTQEELASALFVSRTAISKWESGRGYPSIDSLKAIAAFFGVTIDELLSGSELIAAAEEATKQKTTHFCDLVFGLLDCSVAMFLFLPLFGQISGTSSQSVSLLALNSVPSYLRTAYFAIVVVIVAIGVLTLALQNCTAPIWAKSKQMLSIGGSVAGVLLWIVGRQPYAAAFLFLHLAIKAILAAKRA